MNYASLCSGVGGLDLAVEAVFGAEVAWHAEVDKEANKVLAKHWPGTANLGDITEVNWASAPPVDIVCAGPPCQPVSHAGPVRKGHNDERFLWDEVLEAVGTLRPGWVVLENPPGIWPWLPAIFFRLAQMGYLGCYGTFSAAAVGACHRRERVFVLAAHPGGQGHRYFRQRLYGEEEPDRWGWPGPGDFAAGLAGWHDAGGRPVLAHLSDGTTRDYGPALRRHQAVLGRPCPKPLRGRYLRGEFLEWMMMFTEDWLSVATPAAQRRLAGNAVCPPQACEALWGLLARLEPLLGS
jgi:DNA (cytosine-5)-methyltransferase 1